MAASVTLDEELFYPPVVLDLIGCNAFTAANDPHGARIVSFLRQISNRQDAIADATREGA